MPQDIAVSFSRKVSFDPKDHADFLVAHGPFSNIPNFINKKPWSPIVFKDGRRKKANFLSSSLIALDFDSGEWTLDDAKNFVLARNYSAVVATTKSHMLAKDNKPPCHRFRVVIAAETTTSLDDFEHTMAKYMDDTPCDKACKDGGRFYYPCRELYWTRFDGQLAKWLVCPYEESVAGREEALGTVDPEDMHNLSTLPPHIWTYIAKGSRTERHKVAYVVACELTKRGFSEDEIMALLVKHKSPLLHIGEGVNHVSRCIENGAARVREQGSGGQAQTEAKAKLKKGMDV